MGRAEKEPEASNGDGERPSLVGMMAENSWKRQKLRQKLSSSSKSVRVALADNAESEQPPSSNSENTIPQRPISDASSGSWQSPIGFRFRKKFISGKKSTCSNASSAGLSPKILRKVGSRLVPGSIKHAVKGGEKISSTAPPLKTIPSERIMKRLATRHKRNSAPPKLSEMSRKVVKDLAGGQQPSQQCMETDNAHCHSRSQGGIRRAVSLNAPAPGTSPQTKSQPATHNRSLDLHRMSRKKYIIGLALLMSKKDGSSKAQDNLTKSRDYFKSALSARLMLYGPDSEQVAEVKEKLGDVEFFLHNPEQAERHYREALRSRKIQIPSKENIDKARAIASLGHISLSLGHILFDRGDVDGALEFYNTLDLYCDGVLIGASHPDSDHSVAVHVEREEAFRTMSNVGKSYLGKGEASKALGLLKRVLEKRRISTRKEWKADVATLLHDIGLAYELLGNHDAAIENFSNSLHLKRLFYGPTHHLVTETTYHMGVAHSLRRETDEAIVCFTKVLQVLKSKNDEEIEYEMLEDVLERLARLHGTKREVDRVVACHEEMLSLMCKRLGPKHERITKSLRALGEMLVKLGSAERAMEYLEDALELMEKRQLGSDDREVAAVLNDMGYALVKMKKYVEAERRCFEALQLSRADPADCEEEAISLTILGLICRNQSKYEEAVQHFTEALQVQKVSGGRRVVLRNLAEAFSLSGNTGQAIVCYKELLKQNEATSDKNGNVLQYTLGKLHMEKGMRSDCASEKQELFQVAIRFFEEAYNIDVEKGTNGKQRPRTFVIPSSLGHLYSFLESYETSLKWYKIAMEVAKANFSRSPDDAISTSSKMGSLYIKLGEPDGALMCFQGALSLRRKVADDGHPDVAKFLRKLGDIHTVKMDYMAAQIDYAEVLSLIPDSNVEEKLDILHSIASVCYESGDLERAWTRYEDVLRTRESVLGHSHPLCAKTLSDMGMVRWKQKDYVAARELFESASERLVEARLPEAHPYVEEVEQNIMKVEKALGRGNLCARYQLE